MPAGKHRRRVPLPTQEQIDNTTSVLSDEKQWLESSRIDLREFCSHCLPVDVLQEVLANVEQVVKQKQDGMLTELQARSREVQLFAKAAAQQKMSVAEIHFDERVRRNSPDENPNELRERIALYVSWCKYCQARSRIRSRWAAIWHNFNFILWVITVAAAVGTRKEYPALLSRFLTIARKLSPLATLALAAVATVDTMYNSSATAHHSVMKRAKLLGLELKYLNAKEVFRGADRDTCDDFEMRRRELEEDFDK